MVRERYRTRSDQRQGAQTQVAVAVRRWVRFPTRESNRKADPANTPITRTNTLCSTHQYSHAPIASCDPGCDCTTKQEGQPLIGLVFFCALPRAGAGSWGFLWTSSLPAGARIWPFSLSPGYSSLRPRCLLEAEVHECPELAIEKSIAYKWSDQAVDSWHWLAVETVVQGQ